MTGIRINELETTTQLDRNTVLPAMVGDDTVQIAIQQVFDLLGTEDLEGVEIPASSLPQEGVGTDNLEDKSVTDPKLGLGAVRNKHVAADAGISSSKLSYLSAAADAAPRTVADKLFDWINPMDFGAVGNGVADDTAACNRAIAAAIAQGGRAVVITHHHKVTGTAPAVDGLKNALFVPFSGYTVDDRLTILGMGGRLIVGSEDTIAIRVSDPGTVIEGLHIDGGRNYGAGFKNTWGIGLIPSDQNDAETVVSQSFCRVHNCHITQVYEGIVLRPGADGSGSYYPIITDNHINWCSRGIFVTTSKSEPGNNTRGTRGFIAGNRIERGVIGIDIDYATEFLLLGNYFQFLWATFEGGLGNQRQAAVEYAMRIGTHSRNILISGGEAEQCTVDVQNDAAILGAPTAITFTGALVSAKVATLSVNWAGTTGEYTLTFSNGEERIATLTNGSNAVSWHLPVTATSAATAASRSPCPGGATFRDFPLGGVFAGVSTNFNPVLDPRTLRLTRRTDAFEQLMVVFGFTGQARIYNDSDSTGKRDLKFATNNVDRLEMFNGKTSHKGSAGDIEFLNTGATINGTASVGLSVATSGTNLSLSAGGKSMLVNTNGFHPSVDNTSALGLASFRFTQVAAASATILTSDADQKDWRGGLNEAEMEVAKALSKLIGIYRFKDAIVQKGDGARLHAGVTVQDVMRVFEDWGLDPFEYGMVCYDEWDDITEPVMVTEEFTPEGEGSEPETREVDSGEVRVVKEAGHLYGLRYDELWAFVAAGFEARLTALENA